MIDYLYFSWLYTNTSKYEKETFLDAQELWLIRNLTSNGISGKNLSEL